MIADILVEAVEDSIAPFRKSIAAILYNCTALAHKLDASHKKVVLCFFK